MVSHVSMLLIPSSEIHLSELLPKFTLLSTSVVGGSQLEWLGDKSPEDDLAPLNIS